MKSTNSKTPTSQSTKALTKVFKIAAWVFGLLLLSMLGVYVYVNSETGQRKVSDLVESYISDKIDTPFQLGKIAYKLPDWIEVNDIYFADESLDTLFSAGKIKIDIDMLDLIRGRINIDEINVNSLNANVFQTKSSQAFNYQFLIKAFAPVDTSQVAPEASSTYKLSIDEINVQDLALSYLDEISAIDFSSKLKKLHVSFNKIDLDKNSFDLKDLNLESGFVSVHTGLAEKLLEEPQTSEALGFNIEHIGIKKVDWSYHGDDLGVKNKVNFDKFGIDFNKIDLANELVDIDEISLENSDFSLALFQVPSTKPSSESSDSKWKVKVGDILFKNNTMDYDDLEKPEATKGLDPSHISLSNFNAKIQDILYSNTQTSLYIKNLAFIDKSTFRLNKFAGKIQLNDQKVSLADFKIETPQSKLDFETLLTFKSMDEFSNNFEKVKFDIAFNNCFVGMQDVVLLKPTLIADSVLSKIQDLDLKFDAKLKGTYADFEIDRMKVSGLEKTALVFNGKVRGLNDYKKLKTDLVFTKMMTSRRDVERVFGNVEALSQINIPEELELTGKVFGDGELVNINALLNTSSGQLLMNGALLHLAETSKMSYEGTLETEDLMVNELLKEDYKLGRLSTKMELSANAALTDLNAKGVISKVFYNNYDYTDLNLNLSMKDSLVNLTASSSDKNLNFLASIETDLKNTKMPAKGQIELVNINLEKINLYELSSAISGFIKFDMVSTLPESLEGNFESNKLKIGTKDIGTSTGRFDSDLGLNKAAFNSSFLDIKLTTTATYTQLAEVVLAEINNYYRLDTLSYSDQIKAQNFSLNLVAKDHSIWSTFLPELQFKNAISFNLAKGTDGLQSKADFGGLKYKEYGLEGFSLSMNGKGERLEGITKLNKFISGTTEFDQNELVFEVAANKLLATYFSSPQKGKESNSKLGFSMEKLGDGVQLYLQELRLESVDYSISETPIFASENGLKIDNLVLAKGAESMLVNADYQKLGIRLNAIEIHPFMELAGYASYDLSGKLSGDFFVQDYMQEYLAKGTLELKKLKLGEIDNGDVKVVISSLNAAQMLIDGELQGSNLTARVNGRLGFEENLPLDFVIDMGRFDTKLLEQLAPEAIKSAGGIMNGKLNVKGTPDKPKVNGKLGFENVRINSSYLGTPIRINQQAINFNGQLVTFDDFVVLDSLNQQLKLKGKVDWANLDQVKYNLALETKNFLLLDSKKGVNELYFGRANIDANLTIEGIGEKPTIGGNLKVNGNSDVTIIMPAEVEDIKGSDIITFIPPKNYVNPDSAQVEKQSSLEAFASRTNEIIVDIETDPRAQLVIVVDEFSGDNIKVKGQANLTAGIYPSGEIFLIGIYEIASGSYDFSLEILKRNFQLEKGGTIIWSGDPYKASIQLQAFYEVNTDIQSLNSLGLNVDSYGKVPIDVLLKIEGTIENPLISFDLRASDKAESSIKSIIENNDIFASLRRNESEMNRQVFSLLVLNKFFNEQSINTSTVFNSEAIARQSVSKLLTEQLNMLAGDFLGSVGLNFGLNSDQLNTGSEDSYRTNLNVGFKKSFLNERVRVSVGKNFELENTSGIDQNSAEILDNIEVAYNITPDGRYAVKVYRNNQFQTVLEGFVLETGVSFVLTGDYNSFGELFHKNRSK